jgi:hypothetical protein
MLGTMDGPNRHIDGLPTVSPRLLVNCATFGDDIGCVAHPLALTNIQLNRNILSYKVDEGVVLVVMHN